MMVPLSPAHAELADKYVNPVTGQDCVKETGASLKSGSAFVEISFSNSCDRVFSICYAKSDGGPCISELGISANGTMTLIVRAENYPGYWWTK